MNSVLITLFDLILVSVKNDNYCFHPTYIYFDYQVDMLSTSKILDESTLLALVAKVIKAGVPPPCIKTNSSPLHHYDSVNIPSSLHDDELINFPSSVHKDTITIPPSAHDDTTNIPSSVNDDTISIPSSVKNDNTKIIN